MYNYKHASRSTITTKARRCVSSVADLTAAFEPLDYQTRRCDLRQSSNDFNNSNFVAWNADTCIYNINPAHSGTALHITCWIPFEIGRLTLYQPLACLVVDEEQMKSGGVRVVVMMKRVAMGRTAGGVDQAVGIRSRREWQRHKMSRKQLVGITGHKVQADGGSEVLVERQEVWEEWTGQTVEDTE